MRGRSGWCSRCWARGGVADGVHDGGRGEQARDDRQGDGGADPDQADQAEGEQGAGDGPQVVHGPLEPIRPPVDGGREDVGQQGVAGRDAQAAGGPGPGPEHADLPDGGGRPDEAGEDGGGGVAGDGLGAAAARVVGDGPAGQPGRSGQPVGDAFDEAEGGGRGAQGGGEQVGEQGGGDLVADVGQETGRADPGHARPEPALRGVGWGFGHGGQSGRPAHWPPAGDVDLGGHPGRMATARRLGWRGAGLPAAVPRPDHLPLGRHLQHRRPGRPGLPPHRLRPGRDGTVIAEITRCCWPQSPAPSSTGSPGSGVMIAADLWRMALAGCCPWSTSTSSPAMR
jgi:hypothetical protein